MSLPYLPTLKKIQRYHKVSTPDLIITTSTTAKVLIHRCSSLSFCCWKFDKKRHKIKIVRNGFSQKSATFKFVDVTLSQIQVSNLTHNLFFIKEKTKHRDISHYIYAKFLSFRKSFSYFILFFEKRVFLCFEISKEVSLSASSLS